MTTWANRYHNISILDFIGATDDEDGDDNWSTRL